MKKTRIIKKNNFYYPQFLIEFKFFKYKKWKNFTYEEYDFCPYSSNPPYKIPIKFKTKQEANIFLYENSK